MVKMLKCPIFLPEEKLLSFTFSVCLCGSLKWLEMYLDGQTGSFQRTESLESVHWKDLFKRSIQNFHPALNMSPSPLEYDDILEMSSLNAGDMNVVFFICADVSLANKQFDVALRV